ncbi:hypothetical protein BAE44_0006957 [Dichanthelium oligosanthes]|uniref:MATH domain-containing protein n=1 Tax=Dichanthelium oligosanthes TaxID=888268 RepID=A0A1E5W3P0_9POAL|nr:hypothetical protein BAE44_0006957 [Dichanthelium oligosanthes]
MPASPPAAGDGSPSRSAPAGAACGYHLLKIVGYSRTKSGPSGKGIKSRPFTVGGRTWFVEYCPSCPYGPVQDKYYFSFISLALVLVDTVAEDAKARVTISLLDQDGNLVPSYSQTSEIVNFSTEGRWWYPLIERGVLEKSEYLKDDSFTLRFDVTVMKDIHTEPEETPFIVVPPSDMHQHFGNLLSSTEGTTPVF